MDDRHAQFLIAVGDLCTAAGLAGLEVEVRAKGGDRDGAIRGIPRPHFPGGETEEADDTGYARMLVVAEHIVSLDDLVECTIYSPGRAGTS